MNIYVGVFWGRHFVDDFVVGVSTKEGGVAERE